MTKVEDKKRFDFKLNSLLEYEDANGNVVDIKIFKIIKRMMLKFSQHDLLFPELSLHDDFSVSLKWADNKSSFLIKIKPEINESKFYGTDGVAEMSGPFNPSTFKLDYVHLFLKRQ